MADTVATKYVYPPNWDGFYPNDIGTRRMVIQLTGLSDTTGETNVIKVRREDLKTTSGATPSKLVVEKIEWVIGDYAAVKLEWDFTPNENIITLHGGTNGCVDYSSMGGLVPSDGDGTGDILLTSTPSALSGDTYTITLTIRPKD